MKKRKIVKKRKESMRWRKESMRWRKVKVKLNTVETEPKVTVRQRHQISYQLLKTKCKQKLTLSKNRKVSLKSLENARGLLNLKILVILTQQNLQVWRNNMG